MCLTGRLAEVRKNKKLSQDDVAKKPDVHGAVIGRDERDEVKPSIEIAAAIAEALGCHSITWPAIPTCCPKNISWLKL